MENIKLSDKINLEELEKEIEKGENVIKDRYGNKRIRVEVIEKRMDYEIRVDNLIKEAFNTVFDYLKLKSEYKDYTKTKIVDDIIACWNKLPKSEASGFIRKYKVFRLMYGKEFYETSFKGSFKIFEVANKKLWLRITRDEKETLEGVRDNYFINVPGAGTAFAILFIYFIYNNQHLDEFKSIFQSKYLEINEYIEQLLLHIYYINKRFLSDCCEGRFEIAKTHVIIEFLNDLINIIENSKLDEHCKYALYYKELIKSIKVFVEIINKNIIFFRNMNNKFDSLKFDELYNKLKKYEL